MPLLGLATELLLQILFCCNSVQDVLALASTCHRFSQTLSSHRLPILYRAAEAQLGPLTDAIRVITYNASQSVHIPRPLPSKSFALLQRLLAIGRIANRLVDIYPSQKWRGSATQDRRLLTSTEAQRLRRAFYRIWLYSLAFHNPGHPRGGRRQPPVVRSRAALLRAWNNGELAEMLDVHNILHTLLEFYICPSNSTVRQRYEDQYHDYLALPIVTARPYEWPLRKLWDRSRFTHHNATVFSQAHLFRSSSNYDPEWHMLQGWGDQISHYYVLEDMLKLEPGRIVWLYDYIMVYPRSLWSSLPLREVNYSHQVCENTHTGSNELKDAIDAVVTAEWFQNNGQTFVETMEFVIEERGERNDMRLLRQAVAEGEEGIVTGSV